MPETSGTLISFAGAEAGVVIEVAVAVEVVVPGEPGGVPHAAVVKASAASVVTIRRDMPQGYPRACPPFR
jgi:hypothetical protein